MSSCDFFFSTFLNSPVNDSNPSISSDVSTQIFELPAVEEVVLDKTPYSVSYSLCIPLKIISNFSLHTFSSMLSFLKKNSTSSNLYLGSRTTAKDNIML
ncbi:hypothetical protein HanIR_Chr04g0152701 [Helianthus annuus]|nr:hypothetical protein HanIR_Chr04g0152701 [Helianthus annuus]